MTDFINACQSGDVKYISSLFENKKVRHTNIFNSRSPEVCKLVNFINPVHVQDAARQPINVVRLLEFYKQKKQVNKLVLIDGHQIIESGLLMACQIGNLDIVKLMIRNGARSFNNGLLFASLENHLKVAKLMISMGADNLNGSLRIACCKGNLEMAKYMISIGANFLIGALFGLSSTTLETKECKEFMETLLFRTNSTKKDYLNECLKFACQSNNLMIVELLVKHGAYMFNPCLLTACMKRFTRIVRFMLECGAYNYHDSFAIAMSNFKSDTIIDKDRDEEIAFLVLQKATDPMLCNNEKFLYQLLERGISIEKFSLTQAIMKIKDIKQTFRGAIQNFSQMQMQIQMQIPKELFNMISEYSLF